MIEIIAGTKKILQTFIVDDYLREEQVGTRQRRDRGGSGIFPASFFMLLGLED